VRGKKKAFAPVSGCANGNYILRLLGPYIAALTKEDFGKAAGVGGKKRSWRQEGEAVKKSPLSVHIGSFGGRAYLFCV